MMVHHYLTKHQVPVRYFGDGNTGYFIQYLGYTAWVPTEHSLRDYLKVLDLDIGQPW